MQNKEKNYSKQKKKKGKKKSHILRTSVKLFLEKFHRGKGNGKRERS